MQQPDVSTLGKTAQTGHHQKPRRYSAMSLAVMDEEERKSILAEMRSPVASTEIQGPHALLPHAQRPRRYSAMAMTVMSQEQRDAIIAERNEEEASNPSESTEEGILSTQQHSSLHNENKEPSMRVSTALEEEDNEVQDAQDMNV